MLLKIREIFGNHWISPSWVCRFCWNWELGSSPPGTKNGGQMVTIRSRQSLTPCKLTFCFPNDLICFGWLYFFRSSLPAPWPSCSTPDSLSLSAGVLSPCKLFPGESHSYLPDSPFTWLCVSLAHTDLADRWKSYQLALTTWGVLGCLGLALRLCSKESNYLTAVVSDLRKHSKICILLHT